VIIYRDAAARYQQAARECGSARGAFDAEIRRLGMVPRCDVDVARCVPLPSVAHALGMGERELAVARKRRMYADGIPVQMATSWIPLAIAQGTPIEQEDPGPGGILSRLAEAGHAQARITETVSVVPHGTSEEKAFLRLAPAEPVIEIFHAGWTAAGRAVEVCVHVLPAAVWTLGYEWAI
jgi:DNA-binding GntR family transcriptional regulator